MPIRSVILDPPPFGVTAVSVGNPAYELPVDRIEADRNLEVDYVAHPQKSLGQLGTGAIGPSGTAGGVGMVSSGRTSKWSDVCRSRPGVRGSRDRRPAFAHLDEQHVDPPAAAALVETGISCPKDGAMIMAKKTRFGSIYLCANEETCDFKSWNRPLEIKCPDCSWPLGEVSFRGRVTGGIKCTNPNCSYSEKASSKKAAASEG